MEQDLETRQLIVDTATRMFADRCDKALLDRAEQGETPASLWQTIKDNGFHQIGSAQSGTEAADLFAFVKVCGRFAVPLPIAETLLVNRWLEPDDRIGGIGLLAGERIDGVSWGRAVERVVGITPGSRTIVYGTVTGVAREDRNLAGEPLDDLNGGALERTDLEVDPYAQLALARVNLMAGGLQTLLELGLQFAAERKQFGRPIGKFQAIQHSLAVVAAEVAAAGRAADAAVDALADARFVPEVAAAKARVGEAVGIVAEQVHQVHGAMGFTHEHRLHHYSRRAWAWRDSAGNEFEWQAVLGRHLARLGAERLWDFVATRG